MGTKAREIYEKGHEYIRSVRPLRDGVIADFDAAEKMIRGMVKQINKKSHSLFSPSLRMVVSVPSGSTEVEIRAVKDSSEHAGGRDVYMLYESMAAAIGIGIDVLAPEGNMVVDIGGGTTEIAVISLGGISSKQSIRVAGDEFTHDIMEYMRQKHNVRVGERTAEQIKIQVGSALAELDNAPEDFVVTSADLMDSLPRQISVSYQEIAQCLDKSIVKIESAILKTLESNLRRAPSMRIHGWGIWLVILEMVAIHQFVLFTLDSLGGFDWGYYFLRMGSSILLTYLIVMILQMLFLEYLPRRQS